MTSWLSNVKSKRYQRLGREFVWIGTGQVVATAGALVGVRLLTGVLSPETYGEFALGLTFASLVSKTVLEPLSSSALRFFSPAQERNQFRPYIHALRNLLVSGTGLVLLFSGLVTTILLVIENYTWFWLVLATMAFALFSGYDSILSGMQNAARQRSIVAWHQALASWGRFLLAFALVIWIGSKSSIAMTGYTLATFLTLLSQYWFFQRTLAQPGTDTSFDSKSSRYWESRMFAYAWPFAAWGLFTWAHAVSDRWALQLLATTEAVGLYAVLYQLGYYPVTILTNLMMKLVAPVFFQRVGDGSDPGRLRRVRSINLRLTLLSLLLTAFLSVLSHFLHRPLFSLLVAPEYRSVSNLLPGMVLASGLYASGQFASLELMSDVRTHTLVAPKIITALLGITLNILGATLFGIAGIVISGVIFAACFFIWVMVVVRRASIA